jgi:hypothetical protein
MPAPPPTTAISAASPAPGRTARSLNDYPEHREFRGALAQIAIVLPVTRSR